MAAAKKRPTRGVRDAIQKRSKTTPKVRVGGYGVTSNRKAAQMGLRPSAGSEVLQLKKGIVSLGEKGYRKVKRYNTKSRTSDFPAANSSRAGSIASAARTAKSKSELRKYLSSGKRGTR